MDKSTFLDQSTISPQLALDSDSTPNAAELNRSLWKVENCHLRGTILFKIASQLAMGGVVTQFRMRKSGL